MTPERLAALRAEAQSPGAIADHLRALTEAAPRLSGDLSLAANEIDRLVSCIKTRDEIISQQRKRIARFEAMERRAKAVLARYAKQDDAEVSASYETAFEILGPKLLAAESPADQREEQR